MSNTHDQIHYNNTISNPEGHIQRGIQFKYVVYQKGQTLNSYEFRHVYSLHVNIIDMANRLDPVRILEVGTVTSHSHYSSRANSTDGIVHGI